MPKNKTVEIRMYNIDIQTNFIIPGTKLNYWPEKKNEYGVTHNFLVLDGRQLNYIVKLAEGKSSNASLEI